MSNRTLFVITIFLILILTSLSMGYYGLYAPNTKVEDEGIIFIQKGDSIQDIANLLKTKKYISDTWTFKMISNLKKYSQNIKPGRYKIENAISFNKLVNKLRIGEQEPVDFTFNNIRSIKELSVIAYNKLNIDSNNIVKLSKDSAFLKSINFTKESLPVIFIPNTYKIYWNISARKFYSIMLREYHKFWNDKRLKLCKEIGLSPIEITTVASIVEEESNKLDEYNRIAGVYINRIKRNWALEADPTLKFIIKDFTVKRILNKYKKIDSPYNTYKYASIPPGPIRITSIQAIESVLHFEAHNYFFFCAKEDFSGYHNFSTTLRQHNIYALKYRRALNNEKIYR